ncbi:MAG: hypothetical protein LBD73_01690 [Deferribacteraceae bacterium]|jgi:hypothetical protein|nr:hypothetical protein [Deferribacteraceae bacterium]
MVRYAAVFIIFSLLIGCSGIPEPELSINTFTDGYYPCVRVVFPEVPALEYIDTSSDEYEETVEYFISIPALSHYSYKITKNRFVLPPPDNSSAVTEVKLPVWTHPLAEKEGVIYKMPLSDENSREGVIMLIPIDGDIYLRGIVGEGTVERPVGEQDARAFAAGVFITADRLVQRGTYARHFSLSEWQKSKTGKRYTEDMIKQVEWFFDNISIVQCR